MWTVGESNPRPSNANAMYYHYTNGPKAETLKLKTNPKDISTLRFWLLF